MSTVNNEALESIKNEMKGVSMGAVANKGFYFEISENEKDTMNLVTNLLNKLGIRVKQVENVEYIEVSQENKSLSREERLKKYTDSGIPALRGKELEEARFIKYAK
ncbi:hypothetical protein [Arcobacter vandammei]|uniref:hypothetical protein n=1 Tax=Arcobacter vandammei TaxID=2782243 RepID=UPI0018E02CA9|nr:hypothetical protein [Arcobacter vandammei]